MVPTRKTAEVDLDHFNDQIRATPIYQQFVQQRGLAGRDWSRDDQKAWERTLEANGVEIAKGMHVDAGGNINQKNSLVKNTIKYAAIGGAALATGGLALGALGAGAGGAAAAGGGAAAAGGLGAGAAATGAGMSLGGWASLASTGAGVFGQIYGAKKQGDASRQASELQQQGLSEQLAYEREKDAAEKAAWDAEQQRRAPFREAADAVMRQRAAALGMQIAPQQPQQPAAAPVAQTMGPPPGSLGAIARPQVAPQPMSPYQQAPLAPDPRRRNTLGDFVRY
jgi:hypothetical protein